MLTMIELNDENILGVCKFGSHIYGTNHDKSDLDLIVVCSHYFNSEDQNVKVFTLNQYKTALENCDIQILECHFQTEWLYKGWFRYEDEYIKEYKPDLTKLRTAISTVSSHSWVKGKKKLIVSSDYEPYLAIKSIFHSLRILDFGVQIAVDGKISNYHSYKWLYNELVSLYEKYQRNELWDIINVRYKSKFNELSTTFKKLCPKKINEVQMINQIIKIIPDINKNQINKLLNIINEYGK